MPFFLFRTTGEGTHPDKVWYNPDEQPDAPHKRDNWMFLLHSLFTADDRFWLTMVKTAALNRWPDRRVFPGILEQPMLVIWPKKGEE